MKHILYVSSARELFSSAQLTDLLTGSRERNAAKDISGLLLYRDGNFMQLLEGPDAAVQATHDRIQQDPRHHGVITMLNTPTDERIFPDWSMGFTDLDDPSVADLPGYSDFLRTSLTSTEMTGNPQRSLRLLRNFKQDMR